MLQIYERSRRPLAPSRCDRADRYIDHECNVSAVLPNRYIPFQMQCICSRIVGKPSAAGVLARLLGHFGQSSPFLSSNLQVSKLNAVQPKKHPKPRHSATNPLRYQALALPSTIGKSSPKRHPLGYPKRPRKSALCRIIPSNAAPTARILGVLGASDTQQAPKTNDRLTR